MGSIAVLCFSEYPVNETKNYLDQWIFEESDKRIYQRKVSERNEMVWGKHEGNDKVETAYIFDASVDTIIKRLEVMGYTIEACKNDFEHRIKEEHKELKKIEEHDIRFANKQREIYAKYGNFDEWVEAFRTIQTEKVQGVYSLDKPRKVHNNELANYVLNPPSVWNEDVHLCGFKYPCLDFNFFSRAFLEACEPEQLVQLDATDLVLGGWYDGFEHLEDIAKPNTRFYDVLCESLSEIETLIEDGNNSKNKRLLAKLLYANAITALETYLSDTFIKTVKSSRPLIRRVVEKDPVFSKRKTNVSDLFRRYDGITVEVANHIEHLIYHRLKTVRKLYRSVLCVNFPKDLSGTYKAIKIRHDIVHRNGRNKQGEQHELDLSTVTDLLKVIRDLVYCIDLQVKNVYPKILERDF